MRYRSYNPTLARLYGKKPSRTDRLIQHRSELTHTEIQFSDRYGGISFSATMADDCKCARFKMIAYSHPERWCTTELEMTDEQEDAVFEKCCEMADIDRECLEVWLLGCDDSMPADGYLHYGDDALKYDLNAVRFSFITKLNLWRGHEKKVFCTESCFIALMEVWPELLCIYDRERDLGGGEWDREFKYLQPDQLTPSLGDMIIRDFARRMK